MAIITAGAYNSTDDASYTDVNGNTVWPFTLGMISAKDDKGRVHRYLRVLDTDAGGPANAAGTPVGYDLTSLVSGAYSSLAFNTVSADLSDISPSLAAGSDIPVAGLERNAVTDGRAAWIQIEGQTLDAVTTNGSVIEGGLNRWSADSTIAPFTDGAEEAIFMLSRAANTGTSLAANNGIVLARFTH